MYLVAYKPDIYRDICKDDPRTHVLLRTSDDKQCVVRVLLQPLVVLLYFLQVPHGLRSDLQDLENTQSTSQARLI